MSVGEGDDGSGADDGEQTDGGDDPDDGDASGADGEARDESDGDPPSETSLLLDAMLGTLTRYLRMCGYDVAYVLDGTDPADEPGDDAVLEWARTAGRVLVTRDEQLARRADDAVFLTARDVETQLREFRDAGYQVSLPERPTRCGACNGRLVPVGDDESVPEYAPEAGETERWRCADCGQVFWKGSHWDDVERRLAEL
jgi:hypothetical protein